MATEPKTQKNPSKRYSTSEPPPVIPWKVSSTASKTLMSSELTSTATTFQPAKNYSSRTKTWKSNIWISTIWKKITPTKNSTWSFLAPVLCWCQIKSKLSKSPKVHFSIDSGSLAEGGKIYFLLTLYDGKSAFNSLMEIVKPYLKYLTTVDFGQVTYKAEFESFLKDHKLKAVQ